MADYGFEILSNAQYIPMVVMGTISSTLSLMGSASIMFMSYRQRDKVLHRLLFLLSLADMSSSISNLVMPYAIPMSIGLPGGVGNHQTCAAAGFFLMMGVHFGCFQNGLISLYFYFVVVRGWREHDFEARKYWEIAIQAIGFVWCLVLNLLQVVTQSINPYELINNLCITSSFPWNCGDGADQLPCERSSQPTIDKINPPHLLYIVIFTLMGFVCTLRVWYHVYKTRRRSASYNFVRGGGISSSNNPSTTTTTTASRINAFFQFGSSSSNNNNHHQSSSSSSSARRQPPDRILKQVCEQAILYFLVYLNTFTWPTLGTILSQVLLTAQEVQEKKTEPGWYAIQLMYWMFYPIAGFFNFCVYTRLKVQQLKRTNPHRSLMSVYQEIIFSTSTVSQGSSFRRLLSRNNSGGSNGSKNKKGTMTPQNSNPRLMVVEDDQKDKSKRRSSVRSFAEEEEEEEKQEEKEPVDERDGDHHHQDLVFAPNPLLPNGSLHSANHSTTPGNHIGNDRVDQGLSTTEVDDKSNAAPTRTIHIGNDHVDQGLSTTEDDKSNAAPTTRTIHPTIDTAHAVASQPSTTADPLLDNHEEHEERGIDAIAGLPDVAEETKGVTSNDTSCLSQVHERDALPDSKGIHAESGNVHDEDTETERTSAAAMPDSITDAIHDNDDDDAN